VADLQVEGMEDLLARLNALGDAANRIANQALKEAAEPLAEAMRNNVNVSNISSPDYKHIRDDIQISRVKVSGTTRYVEVGPGEETAWRAKFLEFGTSKMSPRPFMEPSLHESKHKVFTVLRDALKRGLGL
jgi:HK97 gp10 family phage protein